MVLQVIEDMIRAIGNGPLGGILKELFGWDLANVKLMRVEKVTWTDDARKRIEAKYKKPQTDTSSTAENRRFSNLRNMATGGTVYPRSGGTVVRVAEAGMPERVEPLDPNGLSNRDKAMIKMLAPGAGGINIVVNPSPGMDERELAKMVSRRIGFEIRRGTI
jgi:hypothetical protein